MERENGADRDRLHPGTERGWTCPLFVLRFSVRQTHERRSICRKTASPITKRPGRENAGGRPRSPGKIRTRTETRKSSQPSRTMFRTIPAEQVLQKIWRRRLESRHPGKTQNGSRYGSITVMASFLKRRKQHPCQKAGCCFCINCLICVSSHLLSRIETRQWNRQDGNRRFRINFQACFLSFLRYRKEG